MPAVFTATDHSRTLTPPGSPRADASRRPTGRHLIATTGAAVRRTFGPMGHVDDPWTWAGPQGESPGHSKPALRTLFPPLGVYSANTPGTPCPGRAPAEDERARRTVCDRCAGAGGIGCPALVRTSEFRRFTRSVCGGPTGRHQTPIQQRKRGPSTRDLIVINPLCPDRCPGHSVSGPYRLSGPGFRPATKSVDPPDHRAECCPPGPGDRRAERLGQQRGNHLREPTGFLGVNPGRFVRSGRAIP